jgi:hypothetical protein
MNTSIPAHGQSTVRRREPSLQECSARPAGFGDFVDCLTPCADACRYALSFGKGNLCLHPDRAGIVARTKSGTSALATHPTGPALPLRKHTNDAEGR